MGRGGPVGGSPGGRKNLGSGSKALMQTGTMQVGRQVGETEAGGEGFFAKSTIYSCHDIL